MKKKNFFCFLKSLIASILIDKNSLRNFRLENLEIKSEGLELISKIILNNPNLREISIVNCGISSVSFFTRTCFYFSCFGKLSLFAGY